MPYQGYFTDDNVGEDHHGAWYKPRGMYVSIYVPGQVRSYWGPLSASGCATFDDDLPAGTTYTIDYYSLSMFPEGDYVAVYGPGTAGDGTSPPTISSNRDSFVKTSSTTSYHTFPIAPGAPDPSAQHKVTTLLSFANVSRGWKGKMRNHVYVDVDGNGAPGCQANGSVNKQGATCCPDSAMDLCTIELGGVVAKQKFTILHEYGHAVAHRITNTGGWDSGANDCSFGGPGKKMDSEEWMSCAANEGFADFVATHVMNDPGYEAVYSNGSQYLMSSDWRQCDGDYYGGTRGACLSRGHGTRQGWMRAWWYYVNYSGIARSYRPTIAELEDELACAYNWGQTGMVQNMRQCMDGYHRWWFDVVVDAVGP